MGIETNEQLKRDPLRGNLFENLIVMDLLKTQFNRGKETGMFFYRDSHGNEVDILLQSRRNFLPVEVKSSQTWHSSFSKGLNHFKKVMKDRSELGTVVYAGEQERTTNEYLLSSYKNFSQEFVSRM